VLGIVALPFGAVLNSGFALMVVMFSYAFGGALPSEPPKELPAGVCSRWSSEVCKFRRSGRGGRWRGPTLAERVCGAVTPLIRGQADALRAWNH